MSTLTGKALGGLSWTVMGSGGEMLFRILSLMVFSRLLTPSEIGLAAAAIVVVQLSQYIAEMGLVTAVIQTPELSSHYARTACTVMLGCGLLSTVLVLVAAPLIASVVFAMPELTDYLRVLSLTLAIKGISLPAFAFAQRDMAFRGIAVVQLGSYAIGHLLLGVWAASSGLAAWSIVIAFVGQTVLETIGMVWLRSDQLRYGFIKSDAFKMLQFGRSMMLAGVFNSIAQQADLILIGRMIGTRTLGIYTRAQRIAGFPFGLFDRTAGRVLLPAIVAAAKKQENVLPLIRRCLLLGVFVFVPAAAVMVALADEIVLLLLGEQWSGVVLPFQIIVTTFFFRFLHKFCSTFLTSIGRPSIVARLQFGYAMVSILMAGLLISYGMVAVAIGVSVTTSLLGVVTLLSLLRSTNLSITDLALESKTCCVVAVFSMSLAHATTYLCRLQYESAVVTVFVVSMVCFMGICLLVRLIPRTLLGEDGEHIVRSTRRIFHHYILRVNY